MRYLKQAKHPTTKKFSRLSDSEIVTPEFVTEKIIDLFPKKSITNSTNLLDIASKQGEFVYAVYKKFGKKIANNFYSIPTSKIAYEFTRKVYKLLELNVKNIENIYTSYDLLEKDDLITGKNLQINNKHMQFDVIVGNPPYQKSISTSAGNRSLSKQLFPEFVKYAINLNPKYLSLITPSRGMLLAVVTVVVQVNGKVRAELEVEADIAEEDVKKLALENEKVQKWLKGKKPKKVIYVKGRLVSVVV